MQGYISAFANSGGNGKGRLSSIPCAVILLEDGREKLSLRAGIEHIRFRKGNIRESLGDILVALSRVFG